MAAVATDAAPAPPEEEAAALPDRGGLRSARDSAQAQHAARWIGMIKVKKVTFSHPVSKA